LSIAGLGLGDPFKSGDADPTDDDPAALEGPLPPATADEGGKNVENKLAWCGDGWLWD